LENQSNHVVINYDKAKIIIVHLQQLLKIDARFTIILSEGVETINQMERINNIIRKQIEIGPLNDIEKLHGKLEKTDIIYTTE
jgi:hypothetical protein